MSLLRICVLGATGKMGRELIKAISKDDSLELSAAVDRFDNPHLGMSAMAMAGCGADGCPVSSDLLEAAELSDVLIDFTGAEGTSANIPLYRQAKKSLIIGSTGLNKAQMDEVESLAKDMPVLIASNMSFGVNLAVKLVELAAKALGGNFDIEIFEAHHRYKKDAPSGTALTLGKAAAKGRGIDFDSSATYCREGITGEREKDTIGFQVLRGGDISGEHTVYFCGDGERIEITHRATSREPFAQGALRAAKWISQRKKGFYSINDVLGL